MKTSSFRYLESGGIEPVEVEVPPPGVGEIQLETVACGICALDLYAYRNGPGAMPFDPPVGHEGVSYVKKVGPGVEEFHEGDRVTGGGFARLSNAQVLKSDMPTVCPIPASDIADEHWITEPASCVVTGMDVSYLRPGDRVAVIGCGFMGLLMVQGLARSCLDRVVGIDINPKRLELAAQFGADEVLDAAECVPEARLSSLQALEFDVVVETSGTQGGMDLAEKLVRSGGRINVFGWMHGTGTYSGNSWHLGGYTLVNSSPFGRIRNAYPAAVRLIRKAIFDLRPLVTHVVSLEELPSLMKAVVEGEEPGYIKGVVKLG